MEGVGYPIFLGDEEGKQLLMNIGWLIGFEKVWSQVVSTGEHRNDWGGVKVSPRKGSGELGNDDE